MQWYLKETSFFLPLRSCKGLSGVTWRFFTTPHLILCTSSTETLPHAFLIATNQHFPEFSLSTALRHPFLLQCWISIPWYLVFRWVSWYFCYLTKAVGIWNGNCPSSSALTSLRTTAAFLLLVLRCYTVAPLLIWYVTCNSTWPEEEL